MDGMDRINRTYRMLTIDLVNPVDPVCLITLAFKCNPVVSSSANIRFVFLKIYIKNNA